MDRTEHASRLPELPDTYPSSFQKPHFIYQQQPKRQDSELLLWKRAKSAHISISWVRQPISITANRIYASVLLSMLLKICASFWPQTFFFPVELEKEQQKSTNKMNAVLIALLALGHLQCLCLSGVMVFIFNRCLSPLQWWSSCLRQFVCSGFIWWLY